MNNKTDAPTNNMEDIDPNIFFEKLQTFYSKDFKSAEDLYNVRIF